MFGAYSHSTDGCSGVTAKAITQKWRSPHSLNSAPIDVGVLHLIQAVRDVPRR
jgi:hypothetical protein